MPAARETPRYTPSPSRGDRRRGALLDALDELLKTRPLRELGTADITSAAGVTRPAFYFYFPTKAAAVAALLEDFYDELLDAAADWYEGGPDPVRERLERGFANTVAIWRARAYLLVAMLDAVGTDPDVREVWAQWTERFIDRIAGRIEHDRAAGLAVGVEPPRAFATVLMGAALHTMERDVRSVAGGAGPADELVAALIETWSRALYAASS